MTAMFDAKTLKEVITRAFACTEVNSSIMSISRYALLRTSTEVCNAIEVHATDLESYYVETVDAIDGEGQFEPMCLPAKALISAFKGCKAGNVTITSAGMFATITTPAGQTRLPTLPAEQWPAIPAATTDPLSITQVDSADLGRALAWVLPAASTDFTRYNLQAVSFEDGAVVATNGHRLHAAPKVPGMPLALLPSVSMRRLAKVLPIAGAVQVTTATANNVQFSFVDRRFVVRRHEAQFPDWRLVLLRESVAVATLVAEPTGIAKVLKALPKQFEFLRLTLKDDRLDWTASHSDYGEVGGTFPVTLAHPYKPLTIGVKRRYLVEALAHTGPATIRFAGPLSAIQVGYPDGFAAVVMPVRV